MTNEIVAQLQLRLSGFTDAQRRIADTIPELERNTLDTFHLDVLRPLELCAQPGLRIHIIVDGLDQVHEGNQAVILRATTEMTQSSELTHVRVIIGLRSDGPMALRQEIAHAHLIPLSPPTPQDLSDAVRVASGPTIPPETFAGLLDSAPEGGWLIARLIAELTDDKP
jgi:hypothetical protein